MTTRRKTITDEELTEKVFAHCARLDAKRNSRQAAAQWANQFPGNQVIWRDAVRYARRLLCPKPTTKRVRRPLYGD